MGFSYAEGRFLHWIFIDIAAAWLSEKGVMPKFYVETAEDFLEVHLGKWLEINH